MTMVLETSVLVAIVLGEPDAEVLLRTIVDHDGELLLSAATRVEAGIVVEARHGPPGTADLELLLQRLHVRIVEFDGEQAERAVAAWRRFGKGRHPAGLNLGDCFSYALARAQGAPLLFKGDDFAQTDVSSVL